jgi:transposase
LVSKAGKYKTTKITALCNEQGQIQNFEIGKGGESDHKAILAVLKHIPKQKYVTCDRGYDSKKLRRRIRQKRAFPVIPKRQHGTQLVRRTPKPFIYKLRWIIEQAFSKTDQFRKLLVRQERNPYTYKQYWYLGLAMLEIQKLTG